MRRSQYPEEVQAYIREHVEGTYLRELTEMVNKEFGTSYTPKQIKIYKKGHHLCSGLVGPEKKESTHLFPAEVRDFIREHAEGTGNAELTKMLNETFGAGYTVGQVKNFKGNNHISSGLTGYFEKGVIPVNKGKKQTEYMSPEAIKRTLKTRFQKGQECLTKVPVGTESVRTGTDGYAQCYVKTEEHRWELKSHLVWEKANGPIPEKHIIAYRDGDPTNCDLSNLMCISKGANAVANKFSYRKIAGAAGLDLAVVEEQLTRKIKERMKDEEHDD